MSQLVEITNLAARGDAGARSTQSLRALAIAVGGGTSILFLIVGISAELQMFGDGSIFSYAIAAREAWAFHWHNIPGRLFSYLFVHIPAQAYVGLTQDPKGGIIVYGMLRFSAPLLGLMATWPADRTAGRVIFSYACLSTACLCPLVFGAPTEMLMAHTIFWPALAVCLGAPASSRGAGAMFAALLALVFTHEGAVVLSVVMLVAVFPRDRRNFGLTLAVWFAAMAVWLAVKVTIQPDDYIAGVLSSHAYKFIDIRNFAQPAFLLLLATLAGYGMAATALRRLSLAHGHVYAAVGCAAALAMYWIWFDTSLLAEARYDLRTALLVGTPTFGLLAAFHATPELGKKFPLVASITDVMENCFSPPLISGAILLVMLIHAVETSKFVWGWTRYEAALRTLATASSADPALGDPLFVSSRRIGTQLNRLAWNSTTPYLSVLVAPGLLPARLVVDPDATYFWLSCATATASKKTSIAIPLEGRRLVRRHACLHR
jgi:hypothetical protein